MRGRYDAAIRGGLLVLCRSLPGSCKVARALHQVLKFD